MSAEDILDAWLEVSLIDNHKPLFTLRLSRYLCPLERIDPNVAVAPKGLDRIDTAQLETLPVLALRLESPGDEPIRLTPCRSEGVPTGGWTFVTSDREPGSWFIFPGAEAEEQFRPTLWTLPGDHPAGSSLIRALAIIERQARSAELDSVIGAMAADFLSPSWPELEHLAHHLGHLPLTSLDLWRRFAHSSAGMPALALRLSNLPDGFLRRFTVELPFAWELVPYQAWRDAAAQLRRQCFGWFGEEIGGGEFLKRLDYARNQLCRDRPAVNNLLKIAQASVTGEWSVELDTMTEPQCSGKVGRILFASDPNSLVQQLLRRFSDHEESEWRRRGLADPELFNLIQSARRDHSLFYPQTDHRDGIINLPILLAIQVATDSTDEWFMHPERIHNLRTYREFDPDWFDGAFDLTIARCLSLGLLNP